VIASLIELLEFAGNRVELTITDAAALRSTIVQSTIVQPRIIVKAADQPLNLDRVVFALAHPGSLRRLGFAWQDRLPDDIYQYLDSGRGGVVDLTEEEQAEYDLYIGGSLLGAAQWTNDKSAESWVLQQLKQQGVELND
jgi:hypothetical protein